MQNKFDIPKITLTGAQNARDLGGYPRSHGGTTNHGVFFRSDSLHNLTTDDIKILEALGITMQIDLRSDYEITSKPSKLSDHGEISYHKISFLDHIHSSSFTDLPDNMSEMYCSLLDTCGDKYAEILRLMLSNRGGCIFSCTAGKDRTGVVAMLLLLLAGVEDELILADYAVSAQNMEPVFAFEKQRLLRSGYTLPDHIFASDPEDMGITMDHLNHKYNNVDNYLRLCGLKEDEIVKLRKRF